MKNLTKSLIGAGAAAAALVGSVAPAQARHADRDGISTGEVIAGAVILGGLAAIIASSGKDRYDRRYDDRRYDDRRYGHGNDYNGGRYGNGRQAVNQCIAGVENWSNRYSRSKVTEIKDIDRTRHGYKITGKLVVKDGYRGKNRYDRGYGRGYDKGRFTCYVEYGRVVDINYRGLDQWR